MSTRVQEPRAFDDGEVRRELERIQTELAKERRKSAELQTALAEQTALALKWTERALKSPRHAFPVPLFLGVIGGVLLGGCLAWVLPYPPAAGGIAVKAFLMGLVGGVVALLGGWALRRLLGGQR